MNDNHCEPVRRRTQEYLQQLFICNAQKSLTSRRNSQFPPYIDE
jgi:hypothetical protein